jgi:hypothetical protein
MEEEGHWAHVLGGCILSWVPLSHPLASCPLLGEEASATCPCSHDAVPHHRSRNSSATVMD